MAVYSTGSINSATPATDLMTALDAEITANGWTFVETYTNGTNVTNVYKSPAGSNSIATDFYVGINRTSTTSNVGVLIGELYNSTTHLWRKYAPATNSSTPDTDYTYVDATGVLSNSASIARPTNCVLSVQTSVAFTWYSNVKVDRMIFGTSGANCIYAGVYDTLIDNDPVPLCTLTFATGSTTGVTTQGSTTREPLQTAGSTTNWFIQFANTAVAAQTAFGNVGDVVNTNLFTGLVPVNRAMFTSSRDVNRGQRGLLKDCITFYSTTAVVGDTLSYTVGATTYNYIRVHTSTTLRSVWMPQQ